MSFSVSLDTTKLDSIIAKLPGNRDKIVKAAAFEVLREAQKNAPVKTGALKAHADVMPYPGFSNVEFYHEYAPYVELGTYKMAARPFLTPAVENAAKKFVEMFKGLFK